MIRSFRHKGLEAFFGAGSIAGIQPAHAKRLRLILSALDAARHPTSMSAPGWRLHAMHGDLRGFYAARVSGNWRVIFRFAAGDAWDVDYLDYH
jgi:proteic killer suppression protein